MIGALATFAPLVLELGKSVINRFITPDTYKPQNVDEYVKMKQLDLDMFKAINDAGGTNASYPWVEAIVRLQRPLVAAVALATWSYTHLAGIASPEVDDFCSAIGFYLFGDRTLFYARQAKK